MKAKNTKFFNKINENKKVYCVVTWQVGIRGINYWNQCYPVAWFHVETNANYQQFMGRSNREFPAKTAQRGAVIVEALPMNQKEFEQTLK